MFLEYSRLRHADSNHTSAMISLLVVDDQDIFRQDLAILLSAEAGLDVVGQASHGREAIALRWLLHSSTPMTTFLV